MMLIKSVLLACLLKFNYSPNTSLNVYNIDLRVQSCVEKVTPCYYKHDRDVSECMLYE